MSQTNFLDPKFGREELFNKASATLFSSLKKGEELRLNFSGEDVDYLRFSQAKVRQLTRVEDASLTMSLVSSGRQISASLELTGDQSESERLKALLAKMRSELLHLPEDPYIVPLTQAEASREVFRGSFPSAQDFTEHVLTEFSALDIVGIHQYGTSYRGFAHSGGLKHWFETDAFATDYSVFHSSGKAVKGTFAGSNWKASDLRSRLKHQAAFVERLGKEPIKLKPGQYRVYLEPDATADLVSMLSYRGVSESAIRQGESPLKDLSDKKRKLSNQFSVTEDFSQGQVPRFNAFGELAPEKLPVFARGEFINSLISPRTAKEYGLQSNGADGGEGLRMPVMEAGNLPESDALRALETGVYLSNLHYLNWSDQQGARVTGMTRYACMWVENGELVAPIVDMRFDESVFEFFGDKLVDCTKEAKLVPAVGSYGGRNLGGIIAPGLLLRDFSFTL